MKKVLAILLVLVMSVGLAACGSSGKDSKESGNSDSAASDGEEITFWMQKYGSDPAVQDTLMQELTAEFKEKTGITVNYSIIDWDSALTKYTLACTGGEAPDVADIFFTNSLVTMSNEGCGPMEINDVVEEMGGDGTWYAAGKDEANVDGDWYGIPWRFDTRVLLYNTEDFEAAGVEVPTTWDELVKVGKALTQTDDNGNITHAGLAWYAGMSRFDQTWFTLLAQAGGQLMNDDFSEFTFDSPEAEESLQFLVDCIYKENICASSVDASYDAMAEFMAGNVSMVYGVTGETKTSIENQAPQLEGKFASSVLPSKSGEGISSIAFSAPISIFKTTKNVDASKEWVKYFCSEEVQLKVSQELALLNSNVSVMEDSYFAEDEWLKTFVEQSERSQSGDMPIPEWSQVDAWPDGPIPSMCDKVVAGQDIKESLAAGVKGANDMIGK